MAILKRVTGPRWVVLPHDSAINQEKTDYEKYFEDDALSETSEHLVLLDGEKPSRFLLAPMKIRQAAYARGLDNPSDMLNLFLVKFTLRDFDNYMVVGDDGTLIPCPPIKRVETDDLGHGVSEDWIKDNLGPDLVKMLASLGWFISEALPLSLTQSSKPHGDGQSGTMGTAG